MFVDTHTHIYDMAFDEDRDDAVARAVSAGVQRMFLPAVDSSTHENIVDICQLYPKYCFAMMGLHPTSVNDNPNYKQELEIVARYLKNPPVPFYAIGETGLDLYWSKDSLPQQTEALRFQIELALEYDLPIVLHTREAFDQIIEIISQYSGSGLRGVFHSFAGTLAQYEKIRSLGDFMFGIGGVLTYKKAAIAEVVKGIPLEDIVLETDSPYLPPVPYRGKRNESSYIPIIAGKLAEIKEVAVSIIAESTTKNALSLFKA